jgi:DNA-binding NtrC family response regulator/tetratricopeptide (TPR) repeat protein
MGIHRGTARSRSSPPQGWGELCRSARVYLVSGAWLDAHSLIEPYLDPAAELPHHADRVECLCLLLAACRRLGHAEHFEAGCSELRRHLEHFNELSPDAVTMSTLCLAQQAADAGDHACARGFLRAMPEEVLNKSEPWCVTRLLLFRGRLEAREGNLGEAENLALRAASLSRDIGSPSPQGDAHTLLANIARTRGRLTGAATLYAQAATLYWHAGNIPGQASVCLNRGAVMLQLGIVSEAHRLLVEAEELARAVNREDIVLRANLGLGLLHARMGSLGKGRTRVLRALVTARRQGSAREQVLAYEYLAEIHILKGELARARVALNLCTKGAQRIAPDGDLALEARVRGALLSLAEGRILHATCEARGAAAHAERLGMLWEEAQALHILAIALVQAGRKSDGNRTFSRAHGILSEMGEQLERWVVEAWIQALDYPTKGDHSRRTAALQKTPEGEPESSSDQTKALTFWLNHPLLGPNPWLRRKRERRTKRSPVERFGSEKGGQAELASAHPRTRDWTREGTFPQTTQPGAAASATLSQLWSDLGLVTRTSTVIKTLQLAETYAPGRIPILILGATGTGKDLLAQGLHRLSGQPGHYVPVNCAAARRELFVAELFGARRGAYTGAIEDRRGLVEEAERGTLFLDEIADLDGEAQGYLLRFLDSGEIRPLGETRSRRVETRVLAATCRNLASQVAAGLFRGDLYGRLVGLVLRLPPLSERPEDFAPLIEMLWERGGGDPETRAEVFTSHVIAVLRERAWPGNVRELKHAVDRAILFHRVHGVVAARADLLKVPEGPALNVSVGEGFPTQRMSGRELPPSLRSAQGDWDDDLLRGALETAGGVITEAARLLGVSRAHAYRLYNRMKAEEAQVVSGSKVPVPPAPDAPADAASSSSGSEPLVESEPLDERELP